ncbi:FixH family protein [Erythrobacter cryptus]|uniref:FixH family protein n=1 Tax=Erythrobacter cryptus TaxID=196588 RepID=UPI0012EBF7B9|nr:FixH family protein [Erythrobacter cryptus]GIX19023.1 MAG: hypothetical protein KatS3mg120_0699 [Erythrobacter sp.]
MANHRAFTGRHMAWVLIGGFAVVIAVNVLMASLAVSSFHGTVVDNSYAASQNYNAWLTRAKATAALGWQVEVRRAAGGWVEITAPRVPESAAITAAAERPLGPREATQLAFVPLGEGRWRSTQALAPGRWRVRLAIRAQGQQWAGQSDLS